jgi:hypothetical protein
VTEGITAIVSINKADRDWLMSMYGEEWRGRVRKAIEVWRERG